MATSQKTTESLSTWIKAVVQDERFWDTSMHPAVATFIVVMAATLVIGLYVHQRSVPDVLKGRPNINIRTGADAKHDPDAPPLTDPTEIVSLRVYPIKSCRGFEVQSTRLKKTGLALDRNWMFIDKTERKFMTIRGEACMTLIDTRVIEADGEQLLEVSIHGRDERVAVPAFPSPAWLEANTTLSTVEIWEQQTDAWEYGPAVNEMFCAFFGRAVALVYKGPTDRINRVNGCPELYGEVVPHHFADVVSLQVASEASIKDLNRRLGLEADGSDRALTIERFRPNIIVRGNDDKPWEEDAWKRIRISTLRPQQEALYKIDLDVVARCARCQVPNVDPDTAEKDPKQPWETLMKFRRVDKGGAAKYKPCFGMLCIPKNEGLIAVGAKVECLETTNKHLYNTVKFTDL